MIRIVHRIDDGQVVIVRLFAQPNPKRLVGVESVPYRAGILVIGVFDIRIADKGFVLSKHLMQVLPDVGIVVVCPAVKHDASVYVERSRPAGVSHQRRSSQAACTALQCRRGGQGKEPRRVGGPCRQF